MTTEPLRNGDCFEANANALIDMGPSNEGWVLCHGVPVNRIDRLPFGHAWLENAETVHDHSNGSHSEIPKDLYYAIGNIPAYGHETIHKYTSEQVVERLLEHEHWGPWDLDSPR